MLWVWLRRRWWGGCIPCAAVAFMLTACSVYEPQLLGRQLDEAAAGGAGGGPARDAGPDPDASDDSGDVTVRCGDGEVSLDEKCDIAIEPGQPGACPTACPPLVDCVARELSHSNCQTECLVLAQRCIAGDGCCPSSCSNENDPDCSQQCGDGIVQQDEGETCEPDTDAGTGCETA